MRSLSNYQLLLNATKSKENGNCVMITPPRNKCHLQVSVQHPPLLDKTQTDKLCVKGAVQSGLCFCNSRPELHSCCPSAIPGMEYLRSFEVPKLVEIYL